MDFETFFRNGSQFPGSAGYCPYPYQEALRSRPDWPQTLIIPTGFGKTAAVISSWLWKIKIEDKRTPKRLVYCLPMRTLVEQTAKVAKTWAEAAKSILHIDVEVDVLMGGQAEKPRGIPDWIMNPEKPTILIGTQDLLVSAALMRGYGVNRYRWPVDFALLHNGALWVFDEVQLTGASLATSAQLQGLRTKHEIKPEIDTALSSHTLWMSATLDPGWLKTVDFAPQDIGRPHDLSAADLNQAGHLWTAVKRLSRMDVGTGDPAALAAKVKAAAGPDGNTIIFCNTVKRAQALFKALKKERVTPPPLLIHSRFRKEERKRLTEEGTGKSPRIVVTTQALEAGVDVTSSVMITELAPWSSMVQRFGRCNRYGECGEGGADVFWIDITDDKTAKPYELADLAESRDRLFRLTACGPADLEQIPLVPPRRGHVIRRRDLFDLFDTDPDLSGFDVDVSLYVRDADDTDVRLFWRKVEKDSDPPSDAPDAVRQELCPTPIGGAKDLLTRKGAPARMWHWDSLAEKWRRLSRKEDLYPGLVIWVDAASGGYDPEYGFDPESKQPVELIDPSGFPPRCYGGDGDSESKVRVSLAKHSAHVRHEAARLAQEFKLTDSDRALIVEAALWHDLGKAHESFVALTANALGDGITPPLAKWPRRKKGDPKPKGARKYFRHELASALGYLDNHDWCEDASLVAYLIAAHHGKVRMRLRALPNEEQPKDDRLFARGVYDDDVLPETVLAEKTVPETRLKLDLMRLGDGACGPSWSARTQRLLKKNGPFRLAWLEALVRIADWRASKEEDVLPNDDL